MPIVVELHRIDRDGMVFNKSTGKPQGVGRFSYSTASSESRDKRPMVFAWTVLGPNAFDLVRDRLLAGEQWDFQLLLSVMFPDGAVTYNDFSVAIEWDGIADLDVTAASVVWQRHDWNPSYDTTHRVKPERFVPEPEPSREHLQLVEASERLQQKVDGLRTPLWIIAAFLFVLIWKILS